MKPEPHSKSRLWRVCRTLLTISLLVVATASTKSVLAQGSSPTDADRAALQITLKLASDFANAKPAVQAEILNLIDQQGHLSDDERSFAYAAFVAAADDNYRALIVVQGTQTFDELRAMHLSYARYKGAQAAGDGEWTAKQLKATQEYAAIAANALIAEAQLDERDAALLRKLPAANRRGPDQQRAFVAQLKQNGLSPELRQLLHDNGRTDDEIAKFQQTLLQTPPEQIGRSAVELLSQIATARRQLAADLNAFAQASPGAISGPAAQTFIVGNPHNQSETVDLFIRPISIPPDWKLAVVNVQENETPPGGGATTPPSQPEVKEIEPGKHYSVVLPAKGQIRVASIVVPVGEVGTNTTARWAVEGKIGDELIGGMVHVMAVPYIVPDLQLPPVGSAPQPSTLFDWQASLPFGIGVGAGIVIVVLVGLVAFMFARSRNRQRT